METSSRHHYIPKFYINGFADDSGAVYVYDKKNDRIWHRQVWPKGIFFDLNRNTVYKKDVSNSMLEDYWFSQLDTKHSAFLKLVRESENSENLLNLDIVCHIEHFLIHLLWRLPKFDRVFDLLFENTYNLNSKQEKIQFIDKKVQDGFKKLERVLLPNRIIRITKSKNPNRNLYYKLFDKDENVMLLGDYPVLYKHEPNSFDKMINSDFLLPISSKRLFMKSIVSGLDFDFQKITTLNTLIINQSDNYICCPNKEFLEKSVDYYKKQIERFPVDYLRKTLFD